VQELIYVRLQKRQLKAEQGEGVSPVSLFDLQTFQQEQRLLFVRQLQLQRPESEGNDCSGRHVEGIQLNKLVHVRMFVLRPGQGAVQRLPLHNLDAQSKAFNSKDMGK